MQLVQTQKQKLKLTAAMQQSLNLLALPIPALGEYLNEISCGNVMIDVEEQNDGLTASELSVEVRPGYDDDLLPSWYSSDADEDKIQRIGEPVRAGSFKSYLLEQLESSVPSAWYPSCRFLIESLNERGYLDEPVEALSEAMGIRPDDTMQALFAVQMLSPTGVGARDLRECLILQLAEGDDFSECALKIINQHLPLLANGKIATIAKKLGISKEEAERYCDVIRNLNPIPSSGFETSYETVYVVPEAVIELQNERIVLHYNRRAIPRISINSDYYSMMKSSKDSTLAGFLRSSYSQANSLRKALCERESTITRVIGCVLEFQSEYIRGKRQTPAPVALQDVADRLELHISTVSRAIKDKYITLPSGTILLKSLFVNRVSEQTSISRADIMSRLKTLIDHENVMSPLSDEKLRLALSAMGVDISRRTVAAYRQELGYPSASNRKSA